MRCSFLGNGLGDRAAILGVFKPVSLHGRLVTSLSIVRQNSCVESASRITRLASWSHHFNSRERQYINITYLFIRQPQNAINGTSCISLRRINLAYVSARAYVNIVYYVTVLRSAGWPALSCLRLCASMTSSIKPEVPNVSRRPPPEEDHTVIHHTVHYSILPSVL